MEIYNKLYALAKEIDSNVEKIESVAIESARQQTRIPIPGGLGTVTVAGDGQLVSVDLDRRGLLATNGDALGKQVLNTIREAESRAKESAKRQVESAQKSNHFYE